MVRVCPVKGPSVNPYDQQHRGDLASYARYLANMDAAMKQKVAMTAAHLPSQGRIADMGMGSGSGSEVLAALYPGLQVIGVDVNPTMVELAQSTYQRPNLQFVVGDVAEVRFPEQSLEGVINSSVLHHVTSYNGYQSDQARRALQAQVRQLTCYGTLIVRDFLAPEGNPAVELWLDTRWAQCFRRFAQEFRGLSPVAQRGFEFDEIGLRDDGLIGFRVGLRWAIEFVLRKDYQEDWESEILEEYTYFSQSQFEKVFQSLGLRVLVSTPIRNPWILSHRFEGQFEIVHQGTVLDFPPTNYLIVGERVPPHEGVTFRPGRLEPTRGFLEKVCVRHRQSGQIFDLVRRPHPTVDVLPFAQTAQGNLRVLVRHSFPRPILSLLDRTLDGLRPIPFTVEPLTALQGESPLGETVEEILQERAGLPLDSVVSMFAGELHYPSPGGIREQVQSTFVQIEQLPEEHDSRALPPGPWSQGGQLRSLDAHQLLRCAQVNGLADHRLEMHIFSLMRKLGIDPGPWLGDQLEPIEARSQPPRARALQLEPRRAFLAQPLETSPDFLRLEQHVFEEFDAQGQKLAQFSLESVRPTRLSCLTLVALPMVYREKNWWVGLQEMDLPAAQAFSGGSQIWVAPAWRLPVEVEGIRRAQSWVEAQFQQQLDTSVADWASLGGPYFPTPGLTPELVYPYAVRVDDPAPSQLHFFPLQQLMEQWEAFPDGHLRCSLLRTYLAHRLL